MSSLRENIKKSLDDNLKKRDDIATATLRLIQIHDNGTVMTNIFKTILKVAKIHNLAVKSNKSKC